MEAWIVPARMRLCSAAGTTKLDFTRAVIDHPSVEIDLDVETGTTILILPDGAHVDLDGADLDGTSVRCSVATEPGAGPGFVLTGRQRRGVLRIRHRRRRWRW